MNSIFASRFACTVSITDSTGTRSVRAFLQPVSLLKPETPEITPGGLADRRRWCILTEPLTLTGAVTVTADGSAFRLLRREIYPSHMEGVLAREGAAANA